MAAKRRMGKLAAVPASAAHATAALAETAQVEAAAPAVRAVTQLPLQLSEPNRV
jgi:hypothetical protein